MSETTEIRALLDETRASAISLDPAIKPTLSVDEFAVVLGISRSTAFAAVRSGAVPSLRFGKRIRIPTAAARRMLKLDDAAGRDAS